MFVFLSPPQRSNDHYGYPLRKASADANGLKTSYFTSALTFPSEFPTRKAHAFEPPRRRDRSNVTGLMNESSDMICSEIKKGKNRFMSCLCIMAILFCTYCILSGAHNHGLLVLYELLFRIPLNANNGD